MAGVLLFALAMFVAWTSIITLLGRYEPQTTRVGIAILLSAAVFMPWLATRSVNWRQSLAVLLLKQMQRSPQRAVISH